MKVLLVGNGGRESNDRSFERAFVALGHRVLFFDEQGRYDSVLHSRVRGFMARLKNRFFWRRVAAPVQSELISLATNEKPDLVLILKGFHCKPETMSTLKERNPKGKLFCFNPDNPFNVWHHGASNSWIRGAVSLYDAYFIWGRFLIEPLRKAGARRVEYLPFAYDPAFHYPVRPSSEEVRVYGSELTFIGSWDEEREYWLSHVLDYDLKIWGNHWEKAGSAVRGRWQGRPVIGEEFSKVCNAAKVVLNIVRKQNIPSHNMRTFEVPACGGFLLGTRTDEQCKLFQEDESMVFFSTPSELREKVDYYLKHEEERNRIAEDAFATVKPHTFTARAKKIIQVYDAL